MSKNRKALITGVTGQDGAYLSRFLLKKGYEVHGTKRRSSSFNTKRIDDIYEDKHLSNNNFFLHYSDLTDTCNIFNLIEDIKPDEVYNLGAMSHVQVSFEMPEYTSNVDGTGALRILEGIRKAKLTDHTRFYQASTSELYGKVQEVPQKEITPFYPRSPYAAAKLYAYWITVNYREAYGMHASNGILFNHESPIRGETFVTQKIALGVANIEVGDQDCLYLGNIDAKRDWGHAKDFVEGMYKIVQHDNPDDYVLSTGRTETVRNFVEMAFSQVDKNIEWQGEGVDEKGVDKKTGKVLVRISPEYFRPTEVDLLIGDPSKAKKILNWSADTSLEELVEEMVRIALHNAKEKKANKLLADF
jgi:GDPmannose 4,6-dehydratase